MNTEQTQNDINELRERFIHSDKLRGTYRVPATRVNSQPEYQVFKNLKRQGAAIGWDEYRDFYRDLGPKPKGYQIWRCDQRAPHGPNNSYWLRQKTAPEPELTYLPSTTPGVSQDFTRDNLHAYLQIDSMTPDRALIWLGEHPELTQAREATEIAQKLLRGEPGLLNDYHGLIRQLAQAMPQAEKAAFKPHPYQRKLGIYVRTGPNHGKIFNYRLAYSADMTDNAYLIKATKLASSNEETCHEVRQWLKNEVK